MIDPARRIRIFGELARRWDGLRTILHVLQDGFFIVNQHYEIEYANPVVERDFGPCSGARCFEYLCGGGVPCSRCAGGPAVSRQPGGREWHSAKTGKSYRVYDIPLSQDIPSKLVMLQDVPECSGYSAEPVADDRRQKMQDCITRLLFLDDVDGDPVSLLEILRDALGANRICVMKNYTDSEKGVCLRLTHVTAREAMPSRVQQVLAEGVPYRDVIPLGDSLPMLDCVSGPLRVLSGDGAEIHAIDSIMIIPLFAGNHWYGHMSFSSNAPGWKWGENDIQFMKATAKLIAMHLDRRHLSENLVQKHRELKFASEYRRTISRASTCMAARESSEGTMREILQLCRKDMRIHDAVIYVNDRQSDAVSMLDSGTQYSRILSGFPLRSAAPWSAVSDIVAMLRKNHRYVSDNLSDLPDADRELLNRAMISAAYIAELTVDGLPCGWVSFTQDQPHYWTRGEVDALSTITNMIANLWERCVNLNLRFTAERKHAEAVQMAEQASQFASLGALAWGVAHEINRPLSALKVIVDGMWYWKMRNYAHSEEEIFKNLDMISEQADKIQEIIVNMKALSRKEDENLEVLFSINDIIARALVLFQDRISSAGITVELELDDGLPLFQGHPIHIEQIVCNLVVNAIQAMDQDVVRDRVLTVYTGFEDETYSLRVSDTGPGIRDEMLDSLFHPFISSKSSEGGMGLGLFVVRNVVNALGGSIAANNNDGPGAVFSIIIPFHGMR